MNLVRFQYPYGSVTKNLANELVNNLLNSDCDENYREGCSCKPAVNILETGLDFRLELLLPGFRKEDVQLNYHENMLTVKVELPEKTETNDEVINYFRREFDVYNFERRFRIPRTVNAENISAQFDNGILKLVLPKKMEAVEKDPVEIKIG